MAKENIDLEKFKGWAKDTGFVYPSSEIYGGLANTYDFGPYGARLKENIKNAWIKKFFTKRDDNYLIDSSVIINPKVWQASGHTESFADVMVEDTKTNKRYRADHLIEDHYAAKNEDIKVDGMEPEELAEIINKEGITSPDGNDLSEPRRFNQLFETEIGIVEEGKNQAYLRGEIAQGLFINYKNIMDSMHPKLPFGIGQVGKAFRNEITKGQFTFRTLEFDLMEFEYFFDPEAQDWNELFEYWKKEINDFALEMGIDENNLRWRPHEEFELSHYSDRTEDLEYKFDWGFKEMFAVAYRTDFDLRNHQEQSGKKLEYISPDGKRRLIPHVVEPTFGLSRFITIMLLDRYFEEEVDGQTRVVLKLEPSIAPVKVTVLPLMRKDELKVKARSIYESLQDVTDVEYDETGSIGKRYRRQDEIGTPLCVTVDYDTLETGKVTVRDRDTMEQEHMAIEDLEEYVKEKIFA